MCSATLCRVRPTHQPRETLPALPRILRHKVVCGVTATHAGFEPCRRNFQPAGSAFGSAPHNLAISESVGVHTNRRITPSVPTPPNLTSYVCGSGLLLHNPLSSLLSDERAAVPRVDYADRCCPFCLPTNRMGDELHTIIESPNSNQTWLQFLEDFKPETRKLDLSPFSRMPLTAQLAIALGNPPPTLLKKDYDIWLI